MDKIEIIQPAISIALCTYNGERFLVEQLDSILNQDYKNITEIICVDDRSKDSTWDILKKYASQYPAFKIFQNTNNLGFVKNYEKAITLTTNPFIAISDQDDIWYPCKISKLVTAIGNNLMIYSDNDYIDSNGQKIGIRFSDKRNLSKTTSCLNFTLFNAISGHTILFKRELLRFALPFPTDIHYDWWLAFCASQHAAIQVIHEPLVGYRQHIANAVGGYGVNKKVQEFQILDETKVRINHFVKNISNKLQTEKQVLEILAKSYVDKSFKMRLKRIDVFWKNRDDLLLFKKRGNLRKMIYCVKAFWKYD
jgi:glycosyltransferase involved in cell wall biosynthesis